MADALPKVLRITDLRGGVSDEHPAHVPDGTVVEAWDVDFWDGRCGGRRNGSTSVVGSLADVTGGLFVHTPTNAASADRLWRASRTNGGQPFTFYDSAYSGTTPTYSPTDDEFNISNGLDMASLHGKLFIAVDNQTAADSAIARLRVFDGTVLRRAGQAPPAAAPTAADTGSGTLADARKYRVRFTVQSSGVTLLRSEPSAELSFTPSGSGSAVRVTRPTAVEGATHWELEEVALNGVDWYRIATTAIATTTYDDSLALVAVATTGTLSADIGAYSLPPSAKFLAIDDDRLILLGDHENSANGATAVWTPVKNDPNGVGNDERIDLTVTSRLDFDTGDGGDLTGGIGWQGKVIVFKKHRTYQMVRTSSRQRAYLPDTLSMIYGALPHSIVEATTDAGVSALLFLDAKAGPCIMSGMSGPQPLMGGRLRRKWTETFNASAVIPCSAVFHADKGQVWWHIAAGAWSVPSERWVYDLATGGITFHTLPLPAFAATYFAGAPHFSADTGVGSNTNRIVKGDDPSAISDYGTGFRAYVRSKAYQLGALFRRFGVQAAVLEAQPSAGTTIEAAVIRDYGKERRSVMADLTPEGGESHVTIPLDAQFLSECLALQFEFGDPEARACAAWQVDGLAAAWTLGSPTTGV